MAHAQGREPSRAVPAQARLEAIELAALLPNLTVAARQVAATVIHGVHGRRRPGAGESFWQFRPYVMGEPTSRIDWRRSARDDRVYVREREWEAAHTVWLWIDRSPSMRFVSGLATQSKIERALVLGLATADLLVRGGERVGLIGLARPMAARDIVDRLAEIMAARERSQAGGPEELPATEPIAPRAQAILIGDFLCPAEDAAQAVRTLAEAGARGHIVIIADPAEETFPYAGHAEFAALDAPLRIRLGRAEGVRDAYVARLAAHREAIRAAAAAHGWSFAIHRTDRPAAEALLALQAQLDAPEPSGRAPGEVA